MWEISELGMKFGKMLKFAAADVVATTIVVIAAVIGGTTAAINDPPLPHYQSKHL
jgi:hypothetical protein